MTFAADPARLLAVKEDKPDREPGRGIHQSRRGRHQQRGAGAVIPDAVAVEVGPGDDPAIPRPGIVTMTFLPRTGAPV